MKTKNLFGVIVLVLCCGMLSSCGENSDVKEKDSTPVQTHTIIKEDEQFKKDVEEDEELVQKGAIGRIDYPLIDIYFDKNKNYRVILRELYSADHEIQKEYTDTGDFFQFNKEKFSIVTVPSGMGTTLDYVLEVYEEDVCIKTIECSKIRTDFN